MHFPMFFKASTGNKFQGKKHRKNTEKFMRSRNQMLTHSGLVSYVLHSFEIPAYSTRLMGNDFGQDSSFLPELDLTSSRSILLILPSHKFQR